MSRTSVLWEEWTDEDPLDYGLDPIVWGGSPRGSVTFPTTRLVTRVQVALGADLTQPSGSWAWADITAYVRQDMGISWSTGRPDGSGQVGYGRATLKLDNRDGRFSRRNPNSPYFGLLTRNTPIWVTLDAGSGVRDRIQMFVNEWPVRWSDESATDSTVTIQCSGALRRLGQATVLKSPLYRAIRASAPVAFWPMEDGSSATTAASALSGGTPMVVKSGTITFGTSLPSIPGIVLGPTVDNGILAAPLTGFGSTGFAFEFSSLAVGDAGGTLGSQVTVYLQGGTLERVMVKPPYNLGLNQAVLFNSKSPGLFATLASTFPNIPDPSVAHHYRVEIAQSGADITGTFYVDGVGYPVAAFGVTLGTPYEVRINAPYSTVTQANDHITGSVVALAFYNPTTSTDHSGAVSGYAGELATTRIRRLASEEGVPMVCTSGVSVAMGPQGQDTFLNLLRDAEAVDQGVLYETAWGLGFQACNDRTNMPVSLALDYNQRHIADTPEPADDDQRLRNRWTVNRSGGSSYVKELTTGQTGTTLAGVYDGSETVNVQLDTQLADQAGWRLNVGTVDEDRWPSIPLNFTRSTSLIDTWTTLPFGQRMTVSNLPSQMPPDMLDLVIEGFSEAWTPYNYYASVSSSPFSPYRVGTLAQDTGDTAESLLILTPDTLTLAADVNTTDTSWSINSSPVWTTNSEMFPRRIMWEGEEIRLTNCSGASAPQTWTVVRSVNGVVKAHTAGSTGKILNPGRLALA